MQHPSAMGKMQGVRQLPADATDGGGIVASGQRLPIAQAGRIERNFLAQFTADRV